MSRRTSSAFQFSAYAARSEPRPPEKPPPFASTRCWSRYSRKLVRIASKSTYEQAHLSKSPLTTRPRRRGGGGGGACGCERGGWAPRPCAKIVWPPRPRPLSKYVVMALPAGSASLCEAEGLKPHGRANMKWRQDTRSNLTAIEGSHEHRSLTPPNQTVPRIPRDLESRSTTLF